MAQRSRSGAALVRQGRAVPWVGLGYLLAVYVAWGSTYLAIRLAVREGSGFPPFTMASSRALAAGALILLWAALAGQRLRLTRREFAVLAGAGLLLWVGGNGLVVWASQRAESGYTALMVASAPVWVAVLEAALDRRAPSALLLGALLLGLAGVGLLNAPALAPGGSTDLPSAAALLLAALTWGGGSLLQRRCPVGIPPLASAGYQLVIGGAAVAGLALLAGEPAPAPAPEALLAWGYLVVVGSLVGFTSFIQTLHRLPLPVAMTYGYVNPLIAVLLGAVVLHEAITPWTVAGTVLILLAVAGVFRDRSG